MTFVVFFIINTLFLSLLLRQSLKHVYSLSRPSAMEKITPSSTFSIRLDLAQWANENNVFDASLWLSLRETQHSLPPAVAQYAAYSP